MQAVILAAGKSHRFYPFSNLPHKSMVELLGKPLLQHTLENLQKAKFTDVVIVVAPKSPIIGMLNEVKELSIKFVVQEKPLGMGDALLSAKDYLDETFFLLSGYHMDIIDFAEGMVKHQKNRDEVILLAKKDTILERYGVLETKNNTVLSLSEKPSANTQQGLRVIGMYLLNKTFLETLQEIPVSQYHFEKALDEYAKKEKVLFVETQKSTITLKHSWDLLSVKDYLLSTIEKSISPKAKIAKNAIIDGNVVISDDVQIMEGACIKGPCFLGEGVVVGNNAIIRNGVIAEKDVVIGASMEVKNSVLLQNVTTHTGFIGDSIIGANSRLAAGFLSSNVRFDRKEIHATVHGLDVNTYRTHFGTIIGEYVDTGTNVNIMPGISIGNNVTIGPSTTVMENIEPNSLFYTKFETVIKKKHD